jgi:N-acetylgalactosamine PTS system EIIA component
MIGILIFTHGDLCTVMLDEAQRLSGRREQVRCLKLEPGESIEELTARVDDVVRALDLGCGVLAICDVAGGTPWNVCGRLRADQHRHLRRLGGVSMPVLIKALQDHGEHTDLDAWVEALTKYGATHVVSG